MTHYEPCTVLAQAQDVADRTGTTVRVYAYDLPDGKSVYTLHAVNICTRIAYEVFPEAVTGFSYAGR